MQQSSNIDLNKKDEQRINHLITSFAKAQQNILKYSQTLMLMLDRCILNNKFTLLHYNKLFNLVHRIKTIKIQDKIQIQGQKFINRQQLIFLLHQISQLLFKPNPNYHQKFYHIFLSEKINQSNHNHIMLFDQSNRKILNQQNIITLIQYQQQIQHIFICYIIENYWSIKKNKRILLSLKEIILQNKKWTFTSLIQFMKQSDTTPHLITIQHIEEIIRSFIPSTNSKQQEFYSKHIIVDSYHKQLENIQGTQHNADQGIMLFQFQLLLMKIAWEVYPKQMERKSNREVMERYFKYLGLRKNEEIDSQINPSLNRKMHQKMKQYYQILNKQSQIQSKKTLLEDSKKNPMQEMSKKIRSQVTQANDLGIDLFQTFKALDKQLPKLPIEVKVIPECTLPYKKQQSITIGQQPPPQPIQKGQKTKIQKKNENKKDEQKIRQFLWQDIPIIKLSSQDYFKQIENKLQYSIKQLNSINRGGIIKYQSYPITISQIIFPTQLPNNIIIYIENAISSLNQRNFYQAIQNYNFAIQLWKKTNIEYDCTIELFFEYSKGNVYLSAQKYQYALQYYFNCRRLIDTTKLPFSNPDRSLPYFGLGQLFYQIQWFELAARCFLKARQIRQNLLGIQNVQTATVFNNLACCYFVLGRSHQALAYIEIAQVVIDTNLGQHHQRSMICKTNLKKIQRGLFIHKPQYRKLWQVFEQDVFEKKKKKKKDTTKKK